MSACVQSCPMNFPALANAGYCKQMFDINPEFRRMRCDPFVRLVNVPTKSFMVKRCENPCAPKDALDRSLSACYDHHRQFWAPKSQTVMQCETYRLFPWGRCQTRMCKLRCCPDDPCCSCELCDDQQLQICVNHEPYRNDSNHVNTDIASPHISNTNRGFARSLGGNFCRC